jgi:hypothetical protein
VYFEYPLSHTLNPIFHKPIIIKPIPAILDGLGDLFSQQVDPELAHPHMPVGHQKGLPFLFKGTYHILKMLLVLGDRDFHSNTFTSLLSPFATPPHPPPPP